ncbi:MAG: peptide chain release factor N(5)-glutamine methyltransferase [bacterium]|nr:peptide chain release factor N(5)-glutamine methyltransferase [bacterium]
MISECDLKKKAKQILQSGSIECAEFEAAQISRFVLKNSAAQNVIEQLEKICKMRCRGFPLQYIFGEWEFFSLDFAVGPGVLIPRADTEILVERALEFLKTQKAYTVVDLCSGSGCIAVAIKKNCQQATVLAVEKSKKAYEYLVKNIKKNNVGVEAILFDALKFKKNCDLIVCNPPYIESYKIDSLQREVSHEPQMALDGGPDGLKFYRNITKNAAQMLNSGGKLMFEVGYNQAASVTKLLLDSGFCDVEVYKDYGGNDRVVSGMKKQH